MLQVLLLDEITVDLDVLGRADLLAFLREECEQRGATIIYVRSPLHPDERPSWRGPGLLQPTAIYFRIWKSRALPLVGLALKYVLLLCLSHNLFRILLGNSWLGTPL